LSGWVEKKGGKSFGMDGSWQRRYMVVKAPGVLQYWKDGDTSKEPNGVVVLKSITDISTPTVKKGEPGRLDLELPDSCLKFRFLQNDDVAYWTNGIKAWKDYILEESFLEPSSSLYSGGIDDDYSKVLCKSPGQQAQEQSDDLFATPRPLEGWLEKKSNSSFGGSYQRRFFRVNETKAALEYGASLRDVEVKPNAMDLRVAVDVTQDHVWP
jgi:PH domain